MLARQTPEARAARADATSRTKLGQHIDGEQVTRDYLAGDSLVTLSGRYGASGDALRRILSKAGIDTRTRAEAQVLRAAAENPEAKATRYRLSSASLTGRVMSQDSLAARALSNQDTQRLVGRHEPEVCDLLRSVGLQVRPQLAVGRYNLDLAVGEHLAVEVHTSRHAPNLVNRAATPKRRVNDLTEQGWRLLYLWCPDGINPEDCDQVVTLAQILSPLPPTVAQQLVVRCHGYPPALGRPRNDQRPVIPAAGGGDHPDG
jgi:very-short-patch-repair endonuclease